MTSPQSETASARVLNTSAAASMRAAGPTAERASWYASSKGLTRRRWRAPKLLIARAAAPRLSGLRVATRITRRRSSSADCGKSAILRQLHWPNSPANCGRSECCDYWVPHPYRRFLAIGWEQYCTADHNCLPLPIVGRFPCTGLLYRLHHFGRTPL